MVEPTPAHTEKTGRMLTRERFGQEARDAGFHLDAMIEGRLKEIGRSGGLKFGLMLARVTKEKGKSLKIKFVNRPVPRTAKKPNG